MCVQSALLSKVFVRGFRGLGTSELTDSYRVLKSAGTNVFDEGGE